MGIVKSWRNSVAICVISKPDTHQGNQYRHNKSPDRHVRGPQFDAQACEKRSNNLQK